MSLSGKKNKKVKGKTLALSEFLADGTETPEAGKTVVMAPKKFSSWADEMDDMGNDDISDVVLRTEALVLPTAPRAARGPDIDLSRITTQPPFTAYIANLPYDISNTDISNFFKGLKIEKIRLPREGGESGRLKGFGYVEFMDRQDLIEALSKSDQTLKNRQIFINLAGVESEGFQKDDKRRREIDDRSFQRDWRTVRDDDSFKPERKFEHASSASRFYDRGNDRIRGVTDFHRSDNSNLNELWKHNSNDRSESHDSSSRRGYERRGFVTSSSFNKTNSLQRTEYNQRVTDSCGRHELEQKWRKETNVGSRQLHEESEDSKSELKGRPRLVLKPRSTPREETAVADPGKHSAIFGGAKPVDTSQKEREIELRSERKRMGLPLPDVLPESAKYSWMDQSKSIHYIPDTEKCNEKTYLNKLNEHSQSSNFPFKEQIPQANERIQPQFDGKERSITSDNGSHTKESFSIPNEISISEQQMTGNKSTESGHSSGEKKESLKQKKICDEFSQHENEKDNWNMKGNNTRKTTQRSINEDKVGRFHPQTADKELPNYTSTNIFGLLQEEENH